MVSLLKPAPRDTLGSADFPAPHQKDKNAIQRVTFQVWSHVAPAALPIRLMIETLSGPDNYGRRRKLSPARSVSPTLTPDLARKFAEALLAHADAAEGK